MSYIQFLQKSYIILFVYIKYITYIYNMKANKIYLLKFIDKPSDIEDDNFNRPVYKDLSLSLNDEDKNYIGFADNEDMFIRLLDYKVDEVCKILKKNGFSFDVEDVTSEVIRGKVQKEYPEVHKLTPYLFEDFRIDNTTIDDVLDKINETGIESLDKIDKFVLKK